MITLPDPEANARVLRALRSTNPASMTDWDLAVDGVPVRKSLLRDVYSGRSRGERAHTCEATYATSLDASRVKGRPVVFDVYISGERIRVFSGRAHKPENEGGSGRLIANTPGFWLERISLDAEKTYRGRDARSVAMEVLSKAPYQNGRIEIRLPERPVFTRVGEGTYRKVDSLADVIGAVEEEVECQFIDTGLSGVRGYKPRPATGGGSSVWEFIVGRDVDRDAFDYETTSDEYQDVVVWRTRDLAEGEVEDDSEYLATVKIPGSTAPAGAHYFVELAEVEDEDEVPDRLADALVQATEAATNLMLGEHTGSLVLPYAHPLLEEGDVISVVEPDEDEESYILRRFSCRIDAPRIRAPELQTELDWTGVITSVERYPKEGREVLENSDLYLDGELNGILAAPYGRDYRGLPRISTRLSWTDVVYDDEGRKLLRLNLSEARRQGADIKKQGDYLRVAT